jgi:protein arginine N-methyltransferase 5
MIPKNYTSFIAPIMSSRIHQEVGYAGDPDKGKNSHFETHYVIHMKNKYDIAPTQELFTFEHPQKRKTMTTMVNSSSQLHVLKILNIYTK